nr:ComEC/Rec2 family competence protein [Aureimonas sp. AU40]
MPASQVITDVLPDGAAGNSSSIPRVDPIGPLRLWLSRQVQRERDLRSAFAWLPIGMMIAIALVFGSGWRPPGWLGPVFAFVSIAGANLGAGRPFVRSAFLLPLGFALGLGTSWIELKTTDTVMLSGNATVRISGRVLLREQDDRGRYRYTIQVLATERPHLSRPPERVRVLVSSRHEALAIGARYVGLVRLQPPAGPAFPGGYDFAFMPYFDGTGAFGYSLGPPNPSVEPETLGVFEHVAKLRLLIGDRIRAVLPDERGAVAAALINGERAGIPDDIEAALRVTGLAHVLSISGFHMALVAGMTMLAVRSSIAAFPSLALRWQARKIAAVAALGITGFYFLLAGDNAATERSFVMIAIMLGAVLVDRPALTLRNVAIAAMVVMLISPHALMTATFQMSFAATAALVGAYGAYSRWSKGAGDDLSPLRTLALVVIGVFLSSLIAGAATAPYAIYHFQRAAPFGLLANVLATPIFSFWIMPLALASVCLMPLGLESLALVPIGWGLDLVFWMAKALAAAFPDYGVGQIGSVSLICFTVCLLLLSFCQSHFRWAAVAPLVLGLLLVPAASRPELAISEDARDIAVIGDNGQVIDLRKRPNRFVHDQWKRAYQLAPPGRSKDDRKTFECDEQICRAKTRSGLRIAWTDQLEKLGELCDTADIAVVARAPRIESCRSGAKLLTLRTLRRTGAVALERQRGGWELRPSIPQPFEEWNQHRSAPWPERMGGDKPSRKTPKGARPRPNDSGGSDRRDDPAP